MIFSCFANVKETDMDDLTRICKIFGVNGKIYECPE